MSDSFARHLLGISIGQICEGAGFQSMRREPLRTLQDVMERYILQLSQICQSLAEVGERRSVNLCDVVRAFELHRVKLIELDLFLHEVDEIPFMGPTIESIPQKHESNMVCDSLTKIPLHMDKIADIKELETISHNVIETPTASTPVKPKLGPILPETTSSRILDAYRKAVKTIDQTFYREPLSSFMVIDEISGPLIDHQDNIGRMVSQDSESLKLKIKLGGGD
jgi:histone H3/H4